LKAVAAMPFHFNRSNAALDSLCSQRSGVIAALGDDAGIAFHVTKQRATPFDPLLLGFS
jgi:hypothetical protein